MAEKKKVFKLKDGTKVPGATKIVGLMDKPFLVPWANRLGLKGIDSTLYTANAARKGTLVHEILESHVMQEGIILDSYSEEEITEAVTHLDLFKAWKRDHEIESIFSEVGFVSEEYKFCGIVDWYAKIDGKYTAVDFKTSKSISHEHLLQLSSYVPLLRENNYQVDQIMIINAGKNPEDEFLTQILSAEETEPYFEIFKNLLNIYYIRKEIGWKL